MSQRTSACSQVSEDSTRDCGGPGSGTCSCANPTPIGETCCEHGSPGCKCEPTCETSGSAIALALSENLRGELLLTDVAHQLTTGGGKPGQGFPCVLTSSLAAPPAKTSASPETAPDSQVTAPAFSSSTPASSTLFDPDGFSGRTYPGLSAQTAVGTSESCLERWPTSGTAWHGGFSTAVSSECRSDAEGCSSSEPALTEILEPPQNVPDRYSLSARAAAGILRRAEKRGRTLPSHLSAALEQVARTTTTGKEDG